MKAFNLLLLLLNLSAPLTLAVSSNWVVPAKASDPLVWGRKDGVLFGLPSDGGLPGPRGLIRVGVTSPSSGRPELLNFIAIEPVVSGPGPRFERMAFSELESSSMDPGLTGKRLWIDKPATVSTYTGRHASTETLSLTIEVEPFSANRAHVYVVASIESTHPDELHLAVFAHGDSPLIEELTVTATMGNYERLREIWLHDRILNSRELYSSYRGDAFIEHENYPLQELLRTSEGDVLVPAATDEPDSSASANPDAKPFWHYRLPKLTQYWRIPAHSIEPDLRLRVNGRRVYWASHNELPNGIAFENFEIRQRYVPGQVFVFGVNAKPPEELKR